MDTLTQFLEYANAFEETYTDDNWERLRSYWREDAFYEVVSDVSPCKLVGPDAILKGTRKSLDGFDRRFDTRKINLPSPPVVNGDELSADWEVSYSKAGLPSFTLPGRSELCMRDGKIAYIKDIYTAETEAALQKWMADTGMQVDLSYV